MTKKLDTSFKSIHFVNHSHIDHTWWDSPETCRERNEEIINRILEICEANPDFKFSYETTAALMDYLEKNPDRKDEISDLLKAGQLDVGGLFVSANAEACSEEAIVRNFYFGKKWLEESLGYSPSLAKEHDTPGHILQMPQLVRSAGMDVIIISRGPQGGFLWVGPDGSEILAFCVPYNWSYWRKLGIDFEQTEQKLPAELQRAAGRFTGPDLIIPDGDDMTLPNPNLAEIVRQWNEAYDRPKLLLSTMDECIDRIRSQSFSPRSGDMPNLWVVLHALQIKATNDMRALQNLLPFAETVCTMRSILKGDFKKYPGEEIDSCWKDALLVADHNWGGKDKHSHGSEGDEHKAKLANDALRKCQGMMEGVFEELSFTMLKEDNPPGMPLLVFNPLSRERTDVASVEVNCHIPGLEGIELIDQDEKTVPFHPEILERHKDDTIRKARVELLCRDLPSLGYSTYYIKPIIERQEAEQKAQPADKILENEFYRVEFSEDGSSLKSVYDKELDIELAGRFTGSAGPFEFEFGMFELFGLGLRLTVPERSFFEDPENEGTGESVDPTGEIWRASDYPARISKEQHGDFSSSLIADGEFVEAKRRQKVTLYEGIKRVDLHLELDWNGKSDTVLYLQMPNALMSGQMFMGVPYAVHQDGNELTDFWIDDAMPIKFKVRGVQDWLCFEHEGKGLAIATRWPMIDYTIVPGFPLMWTNDNSGFFFGERYRQSGKHRFSFSLTSYKGDWRENNIHQWGSEWSKPPITLLGESGPTVVRESYASVDASNIVITAFKKAHDEDAIVVRLYEAFGTKTTARLKTSFPIKKAVTTNLIETASTKLASQKKSVKLSFKPFEIKTVKLYL